MTIKGDTMENTYSEEVLEACRNGKPCSYGICDECPNTLGNAKNDDDD